MRKRILGHLVALSVVGAAPLFAAGSAATVTEAVNEVSHGSAQTSESKPAAVGTQLGDGEYLKTGVKSRAELQLANQTVTRLGANTIFNYSTTNNEIDLQAGTVLFSKPKDASQMTIKTGSVTAAIVGTSGFAQFHADKDHKGGLVGIIEGHAIVTDNGIVYKVGPGQIILFTPGAPPQLISFDVPAMTKSSPLITKFHHGLPNQVYIDKEIAEYDDEVARGFIQPATPNQPVFYNDLDISVPTQNIVTGHDNAGQAQNQFVNPPPPPPPPAPPMSSG